jgi:hypothetical protein
VVEWNCSERAAVGALLGVVTAQIHGSVWVQAGDALDQLDVRPEWVAAEHNVSDTWLLPSVSGWIDQHEVAGQDGGDHALTLDADLFSLAEGERNQLANAHKTQRCPSELGHLCSCAHKSEA